MSEPRSLEPLIGDPARQAPDLHRGIVFQIWRSVEAWINLSEDELLYLEGAEDFDIVAPGSAIPVQTKSTAANITLRTDSVLDAMLNYWLVRNNHPSKRVRFRYITTSAIGAEKGNPFGIQKSGLKIWQECVTTRDFAEVTKLQKFLATDPAAASYLDAKITDVLAAPNPKLITFLKTASAEEVLEQLIVPMSWEVESVDEDVVRESVGLALRAYGEHLRLRPQESMTALDRLFRVAAETAKRKEGRILSRDRFRQEFNDATSKVVSVAEYATLQAGANALQHLYLHASPDAALIASGFSPIRREVPSLPVTTVKRPSLVTYFAAEVRKLGVIVIKGSSGMGKSTIAALTAAHIEAEWLWVDLQNVMPASIPQIIRGLANVFAELPALKNLGLDNLNFSATELSAVEVSLPAILRIARNRGGSVIITTQRELPQRVMNKMALADANIRTVPRLNEDEIKDFCRLLGCENSDLAQAIAKFVHLQTFGHPRLVHARLVGFQAAGWQRPRTEDILDQPKELIEEREIARQLLDNAPNDDKELLYRLSVSTGPFKRQHAVALGQMEPSLAFPADSFARLSGPWIDALGAGYYRLSPLLYSAAFDNWSPEKIKIARINLARAMMASKKTLLEANEILFQGLLAEDEEAVTTIVVGLQSAPIESMQAIADQFVWLPLLGRETGKKLFPKNNTLNVLLRLLQFRIFIECSQENVDELCVIIDAEIAELKEDSDNNLRLMWVMTAVTYFQANISPAMLIGYWIELIRLYPQTEISKEIANDRSKEPISFDEMGSANFQSQFLLMILARQMDSARIVEFARAVNNLPTDSKKLIVTEFNELIFPFRLAVDRAWACELEKTERDWNAVLANFESFKHEIIGWNLPDLQMIVCRAMAAIEDEYFDNSSKAVVILDEASKLSGGQNHLIEDQRAILLFRSKKYGEALKIWQQIIPKWPITPGGIDHSSLYACERAGRAAGLINEWSAATALFQLGQEIAEKLDDPLFIVSFQADEAFTVWKSGSKIMGFNQLVAAVNAFERLNVSEEKEFRLHRVKKGMEQIVKWCRFDAGSSDEQNVWEPLAGMCSNIEGDEKLKEIPAVPFDLMWFFLADIEALVRGPGAIFDKAKMVAKETRYATVRVFIERMVLKSLFLSRDFTMLVETVNCLSQAVSDAKEQIALGKTSLAPDAFVERPAEDPGLLLEDTIPGALILLAQSGRPLGSFLPAWKAAANRVQNQTSVASLFDNLNRGLALSGKEIGKVQQDEKASTMTRHIAALRMCSEPDVSLLGMFIGQVYLLGYVARCSVRAEIENEFGSFVQTEWLRRAMFPAAFVLPLMSIPSISTACNDGSKGLRLVARIFLQARFAVSVNIPSHILEEWRRLAV